MESAGGRHATLPPAPWIHCNLWYLLEGYLLTTYLVYFWCRYIYIYIDPCTQGTWYQRDNHGGYVLPWTMTSKIILWVFIMTSCMHNIAVRDLHRFAYLHTPRLKYPSYSHSFWVSDVKYVCKQRELVHGPQPEMQINQILDTFSVTLISTQRAFMWELSQHKVHSLG